MQISFHQFFVEVDLVEGVGNGVEDDVEVVEAGDLKKFERAKARRESDSRDSSHLQPTSREEGKEGREVESDSGSELTFLCPLK